MKDMRTVDNRALGLSDQEVLDREFIVYAALFGERQRRLATGC
jgi:hypothetical protein